MAVVSLRDIVNEMAELSDKHTAFLNRNTGELITINEPTRSLLEAAASKGQLNERQQELHNLMGSGELIELPSKYEQKLFSTIEQFCDTVREREKRDLLRKAISGKRAFREFKKAVRDLGLRERWIGFRNQAFEDLAIAWLDQHGISYSKAA